jgi:hypothetical protein
MTALTIGIGLLESGSPWAPSQELYTSAVPLADQLRRAIRSRRTFPGRNGPEQEATDVSRKKWAFSETGGLFQEWADKNRNKRTGTDEIGLFQE